MVFGVFQPLLDCCKGLVLVYSWPFKMFQRLSKCFLTVCLHLQSPWFHLPVMKRLKGTRLFFLSRHIKVNLSPIVRLCSRVPILTIFPTSGHLSINSAFHLSSSLVHMPCVVTCGFNALDSYLTFNRVQLNKIHLCRISQTLSSSWPRSHMYSQG